MEKMMSGRAVAVGLALCTVFSVPSHAESLRSALAAAYNHNATLNAQRAATRANDESLPQAKGGFRPQVFATADAGRQRSITDISGVGSSVSVLSPYGFGVTISQSLFNGFQTVNSVQAAEATIRASRATLRNVEQNTLFDASAAYLDVLQFRALVEIRRNNLAFLREQVRASNARLEVGEGTRTDVAQSDARLAQAQALLAAAQASLGAARGTYFQIIGRQPNNLSWPRGPLRLYPVSLDSAIATATRHHPAIRATQHLVDAAAFQVKVAEGALLPSLTLDGSAQQRYNSSSSIDGTTNLQATLNLRIPIYQGGIASSTVRQNKETLGQRRIEVDQARDQVRQAVVSAWTQLAAARANVSANLQQLRASRLALSGVIEERNVGQRTQLDVLDAQSVVLNAQELEIQSRRNQVVAGYALVSAIGRLNSQTLGLNVRHYRPKAHYNEVKDKWFGLRTPTGR